MNKATLVIMAAGIGSRFGGGIKQLEPVGPNGEIIMDYSIADAMDAGFDKVVFVIRKDLEKDFKEVIGNRIEEKVQVEYAFQELDDIPEQYREVFRERKNLGEPDRQFCVVGMWFMNRFWLLMRMIIMEKKHTVKLIRNLQAIKKTVMS